MESRSGDKSNILDGNMKITFKGWGLMVVRASDGKAIQVASKRPWWKYTSVEVDYAISGFYTIEPDYWIRFRIWLWRNYVGHIKYSRISTLFKRGRSNNATEAELRSDLLNFSKKLGAEIDLQEDVSRVRDNER